MADVSFNEEPQYTQARSYAAAPKQSNFGSFLVRIGVAKTSRGAEVALLVMAVAAIAVSIFLLIRTTATNTPPPAPPTTVIER